MPSDRLTHIVQLLLFSYFTFQILPVEIIKCKIKQNTISFWQNADLPCYIRIRQLHINNETTRYGILRKGAGREKDAPRVNYYDCTCII